MTETTEEWRAVLMSTKDYAYRNRTIDIISESESVSIPIPDDEVICNGCNKNIYPDNGWMMEYKDGDKWYTYDIYCFDCQEDKFKESKKCVVDDTHMGFMG